MAQLGLSVPLTCLGQEESPVYVGMHSVSTGLTHKKCYYNIILRPNQQQLATRTTLGQCLLEEKISAANCSQ